MAIGEHGRITPDDARNRAKKILGAVEDGKDPIDERRKERAVRSSREFADEFLRLHAEAKRKPRVAQSMHRCCGCISFPHSGSHRVVDVRIVRRRPVARARRETGRTSTLG
jgi:hypothetical protein